MGDLHSLSVDNGHHVVDQSDLELGVLRGVGRHGRSTVHFQQPCLALPIEEEVVPVELETMVAVTNQFLHCFQGLDDAALDIREVLIGSFNAQPGSAGEYLESMKLLRLSRNHLPPMRLTYVGAFMLMATLVRCLSGSAKGTEVLGVDIVVMVVSEAGEPVAVEVDSQGVVGCDEGVDAHVKLAAAEEEGVEDVALADVVLDSYVLVGALPAVDFADAIEDENALALALRGLLVSSSTGFMIHSTLSLCWCFLNSS